MMPIRFFQFDDLAQVLPEDGLEVEFVGRIEVGGYRFGVTVDHDGLVTHLLDGFQSVHATVIEFDALPDPVGAGAEHDHLLLYPIRWTRFHSSKVE